MARTFGNPKELLEELERTGVLHRMIRRNIPGDPTDGLISSASYRVCDGSFPLDRKTEECLGCVARKLLDDEN